MGYGRGRVKTKGMAKVDGSQVNRTHALGGGKRMPLGNTGSATSAQGSAAAPGSVMSGPKKPGKARAHGMVGQRPPMLKG